MGEKQNTEVRIEESEDRAGNREGISDVKRLVLMVNGEWSMVN
jgi:hypothetical protein